MATNESPSAIHLCPVSTPIASFGNISCDCAGATDTVRDTFWTRLCIGNTLASPSPCQYFSTSCLPPNLSASVLLNPKVTTTFTIMTMRHHGYCLNSMTRLQYRKIRLMCIRRLHHLAFVPLKSRVFCTRCKYLFCNNWLYSHIK